jgi:hypothetical protein
MVECRSKLWRCAAVALLVSVAGGRLWAHDGSRFGFLHPPVSKLTPPDGAAFPNARGLVLLVSKTLFVAVGGLAPGDYQVLLDDGTGTLAAIGTITTKSFGHQDGENDADHAFGFLKLEGDKLPFGATSAADLGGRAMSVNDKDSKVVLAGKTPEVIIPKPITHRARCPLSRPDPAVDADAEGVIKLESGDDRVVVKVHVRNLDPAKVYEVILTNPADSASESLGKITTNDDGVGKLKVDSDAGDPVPFGVADIAALVGFGVKVNDPDGASVLVGTVCAESAPPDGHHHPPTHPGPICEADLARPDPAPDADAAGEVELWSKAIVVEVKNLDSKATFDVVLTDPAEGGASETVGKIKPFFFGRGALAIFARPDAPLPFGKTAVAELAGFIVDVKDSTGASVLHGAVPPADCGGADPGAGGGGADELLVDDPIFVMPGPFDAQFLRGDPNQDGTVDITDAVVILNYLFAGASTPYCLDSADTNDDGTVDMADAISLLFYLFGTGKTPPYPGVSIPGSDLTADSLYCEDAPVSQ